MSKKRVSFAPKLNDQHLFITTHGNAPNSSHKQRNNVILSQHELEMEESLVFLFKIYWSMEIFLNKIQFKQINAIPPNQKFMQRNYKSIHASCIFTLDIFQVKWDAVNIIMKIWVSCWWLLLERSNFTPGGLSAARSWARQNVLPRRSCHHGQHSDYELLREIILQAFLWHREK